jgi:Cd2+/Zn2+-exporting ATPase
MSDSQHTHKPGDGHDHSHKLQPVHQHSHGGDACCGSKAAAPAPVHAHEDSCCSSTAAAPALVQLSEKTSADARLSSFRIEAMDCPTEQTLIQNKLGKLAGVQQLEFNLINRVLGVTHNLPGTEPITEAIKSLGMHAEPLEAGVEAPAPAPVKKHWWPLALSGVGALAAEVIHFTSAAPTWVVAIIALVSILSGGLSTYKKGWIALKNRNLNINALMSIAVTGAILIGQWPEAAMVMFLFTVAELIARWTVRATRSAV